MSILDVTKILLRRVLCRISEPSGGASGQASDIAIHAKEILRVREVLTSIYQKHCALEGETVQQGMDRFRALFLPIVGILESLMWPSDRDCARKGLLHDGLVISLGGGVQIA